MSFFVQVIQTGFERNQFGVVVSLTVADWCVCVCVCVCVCACVCVCVITGHISDISFEYLFCFRPNLKANHLCSIMFWSWSLWRQICPSHLRKMLRYAICSSLLSTADSIGQLTANSWQWDVNEHSVGSKVILWSLAAGCILTEVTWAQGCRNKMDWAVYKWDIANNSII